MTTETAQHAISAQMDWVLTYMLPSRPELQRKASEVHLKPHHTLAFKAGMTS